MNKVRSLNQKIKKIGIVAVALQAGLHKSTISRYVNGKRDYSLQNFTKIAEAVNVLERKLIVGRTSARHATERVVLGEDWMIAFFDFIDSFLATRNPLLLKERPVDGLEIKLLSLICAIVMQLCEEQKVAPPEWAQLSLELDEPWFLSKFQNLRATSLVEGPVFFKRNNIFVGEDFLKRA